MQSQGKIYGKRSSKAAPHTGFQPFGARAVYMNDDCILCISQTNLLLFITLIEFGRGGERGPCEETRKCSRKLESDCDWFSHYYLD